jgi:hypothetical protein
MTGKGAVQGAPTPQESRLSDAPGTRRAPADPGFTICGIAAQAFSRTVSRRFESCRGHHYSYVNRTCLSDLPGNRPVVRGRVECGHISQFWHVNFDLVLPDRLS